MAEYQIWYDGEYLMNVFATSNDNAVEKARALYNVEGLEAYPE